MMLPTLLCVEFVLLIILFIAERPGWATLSFIATCVATEWFFQVPIWATIRANPASIVGFLAGYLVVGTGWSFVRWWVHLHRIRDRYLEDVRRWCQRKGLAEGDDIAGYISHSPDWAVSDVAHQWRGKLPPKASESKTQITLWIMYWPISLVWTLMDEPVRRLAIHIYEAVQQTYVRIANEVFRDTPYIPDR